MTARGAARLAWSLWGLAVVLEVAGILLWLPNHAALIDRYGATTEDFAPHVFVRSDSGREVPEGPLGSVVLSVEVLYTDHMGVRVSVVGQQLQRAVG